MQTNLAKIRGQFCFPGVCCFPLASLPSFYTTYLLQESNVSAAESELGQLRQRELDRQRRLAGLQKQRADLEASMQKARPRAEMEAELVRQHACTHTHIYMY
jgi:hypothetical protein